MNTEQVSSSHLGYLCHAPKVAVVRHVRSKTFTVQNMAIIDDAPLSTSSATFKPCYQGEIELITTPMGAYGRCDFSGLTEPGVYRLFLPESGARSYQFTTACPTSFLDFVQGCSVLFENYRAQAIWAG